MIRWFDGHQQVAVAFSGGVDSSVVLAAAVTNKAVDVTALTADSPSVARWQVDLARQIAGTLGVRHRTVSTDETTRTQYIVNDSKRCYHCKHTLYETLDAYVGRQVVRGQQASTIVSGTNADDLGDYRPGIAAGDEAGIRKPLAELGLDKSAVRRIAAEFGLPNADLPASPCLASRIAYGVPVTVARLARIEAAEDELRAMGFETVRVRLHEGDLARVEVPLDVVERLLDTSTRERLCKQLIDIGFRFVTVDLQGFQSGSLNRQLVTLQAPVETDTESPTHLKNRP